MASSSKSKSHYHIRSISLPCRSHPTTLTIEEKLNQLKTWEALYRPTAETICQGLSVLEELYKCVDDLYNLPLTQQALSQHQLEKWVDELLDGSVKLLDICGITMDVMSQTKEHIRDVQSALRRRKRDLSIERSITKYTCFRKKTKKDAKKLISALKQVDNKIEALPVLDLDHHVSSVIRVLREVGAMSISIFQTVLLFLSMPISKPRPTRWLLVSKLLHKGAVVCEDQHENVNELERVDVTLQALCGSSSSEVDKMQIAQKSLEALEASIEVVENGSKHGRHHLRQQQRQSTKVYLDWKQLYKCVDDLYNLPLTQQALSQHQLEKWVDELLDGSVKLLDICGITRDAVSQIKEHTRDLQSALRRRKGDLIIERSIAKYTCFRKKTKKDAKKLISAMKQMDNKIEALPLLDLDHHVSSVIKVLREVGAMSISIFQTVLLFLSVPISKPRPTSRWLLVSKFLHKGAVACENQYKNVNEMESVDAALQALCGSGSGEVDKMQIAQKSLEELEASIEVVENGLEYMFRRLIKSRACLLNIVSH
ncbi:hypothetical protein F0562_006810 [Nyssa sinensis]|uniref:DUF241 domain-containing protein n=1 Tax=Nyssa sinensis TaxID=561372 RepID=A0A5J5APC3_9ASTE|nr:hypothetical protein F0562_006810 [Nyssa sinensis]